MAKLRRTLLIGLGGTGFKTVLNAKKMFYENYGEIPPMIGFLGIDTDKPGLESAGVEAKDGTRIAFNKSEQLPITVEEPRDIFERNLASALFDWMPQCNVEGLTTLTIGAGQMRSNGRFAVTVNENNVEQFVNRKIAEVNDAGSLDNPKYGLLGAETEVHIVFSIGGGTGSGTFLNVAYLIKRLLPNAKVSGYAVLSDVFRSMVSGAMSARVRPNGKGAIMDLDFLAHLNPSSLPIELKWLRRVDKIKDRPFSALYLIDNRNENNDMFSDVDPLCQMISLAIVTSVGELGVTLDSISDNVSKLISDGSMDINNKKAWVASFGCTEILFDGERLGKIYAQKAAIQVINLMLNGGCDDPAIIANNWFDNTQIRENQGKDDVIDYFMPAVPQYIYQEIDNPDDPWPEVTQYIENRAMEKQQALNDKLEALKSRVDESLTALMNEQANRECGIFLCNQILHSILMQVELCDGEMLEEHDNLTDELPRREMALKTACRDLAACMNTLFKKGRKEYQENVVTQTMAMAKLRREIERRRMARLFYNWLRVRIGKSLDRVNTIINNLEAVRQHCNETIQKIQREAGAASFFQFDLAAEHMEKVSCPLSDIVFNNFVAAVKPEGGITAFANMTSGEVSEIIKRFTDTLPKVIAYNEMTVDDILDRMDEETFKHLMRRAINKSLPLLPYSYRGFNASLKNPPVESYYIGIANKATSRLVKDNIFSNLVSGAKDVQFSEIGLKNRIIIYRQLGVIPAFTIKSLDNYATEYDKWESEKPHGSHWDLAVCKRMKDERYSLMPRDTANEKHVLEVWVDAIINDLITFDAATGYYQIKSRGMGGRAHRNWKVDMGKTRAAAYGYLEDNLDVLEPEIKTDLDRMNVPGPDNKIRINAERARKACEDGYAAYYNEISKCPLPIEQIETYPAEMDLIEKEINNIMDIDR